MDVEVNEITEDEKDTNYLALLQTMSEPDRKLETVKYLEKIYSEFYKNIDLNQTRDELGMNNLNQIKLVFSYWKLKRRFNIWSNRALVSSRSEDELMKQRERQITQRKKVFMNLRHDLERLRNLCYLIVRREKLKRQYFDLNKTIFDKQLEYLNKYKQFNNDSDNKNPLVLKSRTSRITEILSLRTEGSIYDHPEKWTFEEEANLSNKENPTNETPLLNISENLRKTSALNEKSNEIVNCEPIVNNTQVISDSLNNQDSLPLNEKLKKRKSIRLNNKPITSPKRDKSNRTSPISRNRYVKKIKKIELITKNGNNT